MRHLVLFSIVVLIWGSTFLAIKFQLGAVDPMVSVMARFALASALLLGFCRFRGLNLSFTLKEHRSMAQLGALLFSLNYWLVYTAETHLTSGLVAVVFSAIVFMNIANSAFFLNTPLDPRLAAGALTGSLGIGLIFLPEIRGFDLSDSGFTGLVVALSAAFLASLGNITSARNTRNRIPVIQANAFGMAYGAGLLFVMAVVTGKDFSLPLTPGFLGSLIYLALFGSVIAFWAYLTLIGSIGADRAAYAILVVPVVALALSSLFEGYTWNPASRAGLILVLAGNFLALRKRGTGPVSGNPAADLTGAKQG